MHAARDQVPGTIVLGSIRGRALLGRGGEPNTTISIPQTEQMFVILGHRWLLSLY